jgi:hypothetical protein
MKESDAKKIFDEGVDLTQYLALLKKGSPFTRIEDGKEVTAIIPSQKLLLDISSDVEYIKKAGFLPSQTDSLLKYPMYWELPGKNIDKDELIMLDIIANNHWKRPIYFAPQLGNDDYLGLKNYMQVEGLAYRLLPVPVGFLTSKEREMFVNADLSYELLQKEKKHSFKGKEIVRKMYWRGLNDPKVYHNEDYMGFISQAREHIADVARTLINEGKKDKAKDLMLSSLKNIPIESVNYDVYVAQLVPLLFEVGEDKVATDLYQKIGKQADLTLSYLEENQRMRDYFRIQHNVFILGIFAQTLEQRKSPDANKYRALYTKYRKSFEETLR